MRYFEATIETMEAQLGTWGGQLDTLVARATLAGESAQPDRRAQIGEAKAQQLALQARFDVYRAAGIDTWEAFRPGIEVAWDDLAIALDALAPAVSLPKRLRTLAATVHARRTSSAPPPPPARYRGGHR